MSEQKKTISQILIERFLKDVDELESMPWQRPYKRYNAFNWVTKTPYRGINRIMLDYGEYLTANQINEYNKTHKEDFKFQKGIQWFPVVFYKEDKKSCSFDEVVESLGDDIDFNKDGYLGRNDYWSYWRENDSFFKKEKCIKIFRCCRKKVV